MATPVNDNQDTVENQQRDLDPENNDQRNHSESEDENGPPPRDIPVLYVPDLANTLLSEAILDGIRVGICVECVICCSTIVVPHTNRYLLKI